MTRKLVSKDANFFPLVLAIVVAIGYTAPANAVLGGDAGSVETDRLQMKAILSPRQTPSPNGTYSVNEAILPTGTRIQQYVSKAGKVFAVTWNGPFMPDLRQLMGSYFDTMIADQTGRVTPVNVPTVSMNKTW